MTEQNISELISDILSKHKLSISINILITDCVVKVKTNSELLIEKLIDYFDGFIVYNPNRIDITVDAVETEGASFFDNFTFTEKEPDLGKTKIKEEFCDIEGGRIVNKKITGMKLIFGGKHNMAMGPCVENYNQVINFINNRYIQWMLNRKSLLLHASGVAFNGGGLALCGFSGMGKSTLALHMLSKGLSFISNDRLMIRNSKDGLYIYGIPKLPRINPGTILNNPDLKTILPPEKKRLYEVLSTEELWHLEEKYDVYINEVYGDNRFVLFSKLSALVILNWKDKSQPTRIQRVDLKKRSDLMPAFMKTPGLFFEPDNGNEEPDFSADMYLKYLESVKVYEVTGKINFEYAVEKCMELLNG